MHGAVSLLREGVGWLSRAPGVLSLSCPDSAKPRTWLPLAELPYVPGVGKPPAFSAEVSLLRCSLRLWEGKWAVILALRSKPDSHSLRGCGAKG